MEGGNKENGRVAFPESVNIHLKRKEAEPFQRALDVKMTSYERRCDVMTSHRRSYDLILEPNAQWVTSKRLLTLDLIDGVLGKRQLVTDHNRSYSRLSIEQVQHPAVSPADFGLNRHVL